MLKIISKKYNGVKVWFLNGVEHRENGPAVELAECSEWYLYGKRHRKDGPAIIDRYLRKGYWYIDDICFSKAEFINQLVQHNLKVHLLNKVISMESGTLVGGYSM